MLDEEASLKTKGGPVITPYPDLWHAGNPYG
jgi:hypothetical protein